MHVLDGGVCKVVCEEPDMVNPNTFENVPIVLRNLGKRAGIYNINEHHNLILFVNILHTFFLR